MTVPYLTLFTLDASQSYNINEKEKNSQKTNLLYTWECNIVEDESCNRLTITGKLLIILYITVKINNSF